MGDIHLQIRNNIYYFRIRLPLDIAPYFSRKEIWKSLKTKNYKSVTNCLFNFPWSFSIAASPASAYFFHLGPRPMRLSHAG